VATAKQSGVHLSHSCILKRYLIPIFLSHTIFALPSRTQQLTHINVKINPTIELVYAKEEPTQKSKQNGEAKDLILAHSK